MEIVKGQTVTLYAHEIFASGDPASPIPADRLPIVWVNGNSDHDFVRLTPSSDGTSCVVVGGNELGGPANITITDAKGLSTALALTNTEGEPTAIIVNDTP